MEARAMEVVGQARGFGDLPAEVTLHIMQFLPPKDLGRCVMVCQSWNALSREDHLWREGIKRAAIAQKAAGDEFVPTIPERSWRSHFFDVFASPYLLLTTGIRKPGEAAGTRSDLENKLRAAGIGNIHHVAWSTTAIPTLELSQLLKYDAVFVTSNDALWNPSNTLGDLLADYVDAGGGVVITGFACCGCKLRGRWADQGYDPIVPLQSISVQKAELATIDSSHPVMRNISAINVTNLHGVVRIGPGRPQSDAKVIAAWNFDKPTYTMHQPVSVAELRKGKGSVIAINFNTIAAENTFNGSGNGWSGDAVALWVNALTYVKARQH